jgi:Fe-S-cluster formation regulator IscX/YfhJ
LGVLIFFTIRYIILRSFCRTFAHQDYTLLKFKFCKGGTGMNVGSVSSASAALEEYLEKLREKKNQQSAPSTTSNQSTQISINIEEIIAQLQELEDDPEALKAKAAELAASVSKAAEEEAGKKAEMLQEVAADLDSVAKSGNLSVITDKLQSRRPPAGGGMNGLSGLSGASEASMKWLEALLAEEDDDESSETASTESVTEAAAEAAEATEAVAKAVAEAAEKLEEYLEKLREAKNQQSDSSTASTQSTQTRINIEEIIAQLQELEDDPEALKAKAAELAASVSKVAAEEAGKRAEILQEIATDLDSVAKSGDLSVITDKLQSRKLLAGGRMNALSGLSGASDASMKWLEALLTEEDNAVSSETASTESVTEIATEAAEEAAEKEEDLENLLITAKLNLMNQLSAMLNQKTNSFYNYFAA